MASKVLRISYFDILNFEIFFDQNEFEDFMLVYESRLKPFFKIDDLVSGDCCYSIHLERGLPSDREFSTSDWEEIEFFSPVSANAIADCGPGRRLTISPNHSVCFNPRNQTIFELNENSVKINYLSTEVFVRDLQRVLKQLIVTEVENRGGFMLHASAFAYREKAYCFVGKKGFGKTTSNLAALELFGAEYITNDRLPVLPTDNGFFALGWFEELRIITSLQSEKVVIPVTEMIDDIAPSPVKIEKVIVPIPDSLNIEISNPKKLVESELLSPVDPQRPKWLGFSNKPDVTLHDFWATVQVEKMPWSYKERHLLLGKIQQLVHS